MMIDMDSNKLRIREGLLKGFRVGKREIAFDETVTMPHFEAGKELYLYCVEEGVHEHKARVRLEHLQTFGISEKEAWERAFLNSGEKYDRLKMKVKYKPGVKPIVRAHDGEWFDLRAAKDYCTVKGELVKIDLGVAIELPEGYEALIRPRSSTAYEYGLLMACSGVIDNKYRGDEDWWSFGAYAIKTDLIRQNDRICQFRIQKQQPRKSEIEIETVEHLGNENRGGFGSTGRS